MLNFFTDTNGNLSYEIYCRESANAHVHFDESNYEHIITLITGSRSRGQILNTGQSENAEQLPCHTQSTNKFRRTLEGQNERESTNKYKYKYINTNTNTLFVWSRNFWKMAQNRFACIF